MVRPRLFARQGRTRRCNGATKVCMARQNQTARPRFAEQPEPCWCDQSDHGTILLRTRATSNGLVGLESAISAGLGVRRRCGKTLVRHGGILRPNGPTTMSAHLDRGWFWGLCGLPKPISLQYIYMSSHTKNLYCTCTIRKREKRWFL